MTKKTLAQIRNIEKQKNPANAKAIVNIGFFRNKEVS